ncbi:heterokaryon incompatibility protein-domain-containing protein [Staphylotrichum tortipilum]|uniref:Heterokaryon incompatibility protein-domain-containing protein n=1 Tax=Staphylotrichum tortipilum TaxID=2831512 RepID=A0AAN6MU68_9PEZI|nr:heterokaryon incompatibility protein-domain-containing protein [Staphylotrichum longicolle]
MTIDINGRQFEVLLKVRGQPMMFNLSPVEFGRLNLVCWKGQQVEQLSVCRFVPIVSEGPRKKHPDHEFYGAKFQVLVHDAAAGLPIKGTGREIADLVDMDLMKSWIETCRSRHGDACERPHWLGTMQPVPGLRVIDVVAKSVVSAPPGCRYLALSYVWGASFLPTAAEAVAKSDLASMALSCNIAALGEEGGLACLALPRTIQDTITLTQALGERYLWVDALCIIQDDAEDIQRQTAAMDAVFSGAVLTVAAAAGSDADHGLPGIIPGSRSNTRRKTRLTNKLSLLSMVNDEVLVSEWTRRGWTFQERLLSRRMLFFTNSLVSWKCDLDTWNEETILEPENPVADFIFEHHHEPLSRSPNRFTLLDYAGYIRDYSRRKLSYGSDILPAFQGVMHCYEQATGERLHWGLAYRIVEMGSSLMWTTDSLNVKFDVYSSAWADCIRPEIDFYKLMSDGRAERLEPEKPPVPPGTPDDIGRHLTLSYVVVGENFLYEQWRQAEDTKAWSPEGRVRPALNALIVEWIDEEKGVARRIGVAQFFEEEWIKLDRDWRRVILE